MPPDPTSAAPIPFRRLLLMPWRWNRWTWSVIVVLMLLGYPLSLGPVIWLSEAGYLPDSIVEDDAIEIAYLPLVLLMQIAPPLDDAIQWYVELWQQSSPQFFDEPMRYETDMPN